MRYRDREELERWLAEVRTRRRNVRPAEAHRMLILAGYSRRYGSGDHWIYRRGRSAMLVIDPRTPLLAVYVSAVISAVEHVLKEEGGDAPHAR